MVIIIVNGHELKYRGTIKLKRDEIFLWVECHTSFAHWSSNDEFPCLTSVIDAFWLEDVESIRGESDA